MDRRAIAALILALAGSPVLAADFHSAAYDQASDLAAGRTSQAAAYDGSSAQQALQAQVGGALQTGGLEVTPTAATPGLRPPAAIPSPDAEPRSKPFVTRKSLAFGGGGAVAGAAAGWVLGGPIGALIGAAAGFAIGFLLSKLLG